MERGRLIRARLSGKVEEGIALAETVLARKDVFMKNGDVRILGNTLVAYALLLRRSVGWFNVEDYSSSTHQAIDSLLELDVSLFFATAPSFFNDLQAKVRTIDPMTMPEKQSLSDVNHVLVMAPQQNEDWLCPAEWFRTGEENQKRVISLLEMARKSVVYVTPDSRPFERRKSFSNQNAKVVATTQVLDQTSGETISV